MLIVNYTEEEKQTMAEYEKQGLKVLGLIECGLFSVANNVRPITCVSLTKAELPHTVKNFQK